MKLTKQDNVHMDVFTPRAYQMELLDSALQKNTIVCLGTGTGKAFITVMLIKELAHQIRPPVDKGGKRTVYLTSDWSQVTQQAKVIRMHVDVGVGEYATVSDLDLLDHTRWQHELRVNQVLVMRDEVFHKLLLSDLMRLSEVNLIIFDECHHAMIENHGYAKIMKCYNSCSEGARPKILGLTASLLNNRYRSPAELETNLAGLETALNSTVETASNILLSSLFSVRPKEIVLECEEYNDKTGLVAEFGAIIESTLDFIEDYVVLKDDEGGKDPRTIPRTILMECQYVLHMLGPWCAGRLAGTLVRQVTRLEEHERHATSKLFLKLTLTQLRFMSQVIDDIYDIQVQCLEDFWLFMSPKVLRLVEVLQEYKPDDNFVIIGGDDLMDFGGYESEEDSLDLSDDDYQEDVKDGERKKKKQNPIHYVAVKRLQPENTGELKEEESICGIVFVERRHTAFALNKLIVELCNWDPDLFFIRSHHITGNVVGRTGESEVLYKKQEDILRKFRQKELNLLISTSVLEEGVDIPKCNLVVRFDLPVDYRSYVQSKGRARAAKSKYYMLVEQHMLEKFQEELRIFKGIEQILISRCHSHEERDDGEITGLNQDEMPFYKPNKEDEDGAMVTLTSAIGLVNKYCAKLPSDAFTHLTPKCTVVQVADDPPLYRASLQLPINSPIKETIKGEAMRTKKLAKMNVALLMCEILHKAGELDDQLLPIGKEMIKYEDEENEWEEAELHGQARPGTTKRKQYYYKRIARPLIGHPLPDQKCNLYTFNMKLTCPITEEQNTRGRKIHAPEDSPRGFGIICEKMMPLVPYFPVFTRSGQVTVSLELTYPDITFNSEELDKMKQFHHFVFSKVLRLEKEPMVFDPENAECSYLVVPLNYGQKGETLIDWDFIAEVARSPIKVSQRNVLFKPNKEKFVFNEADFDDAVVMPSYRNIDQPQYFYVAEIRHDLNPKSSFPSPELYDTFEHYYRSKYGLEITNMQQPLLDVDHTSARLNLLTPRYMNQKGVALPTSSAETRRARRENLQQKQILLPELCDIHQFPASLWRKAVCIPAILYRMNYLLIAEEIRKLIAEEAHIGVSELPEDFRFPQLEFGFSTKPSDAIPVKVAAAVSNKLAPQAQSTEERAKSQSTDKSLLDEVNTLGFHSSTDITLGSADEEDTDNTNMNNQKNLSNMKIKENSGSEQGSREDICAAKVKSSADGSFNIDKEATAPSNPYSSNALIVKSRCSFVQPVDEKNGYVVGCESSVMKNVAKTYQSVAINDDLAKQLKDVNLAGESNDSIVINTPLEKHSSPRSACLQPVHCLENICSKTCNFEMDDVNRSVINTEQTMSSDQVSEGTDITSGSVTADMSFSGDDTRLSLSTVQEQTTSKQHNPASATLTSSIICDTSTVSGCSSPQSGDTSCNATELNSSHQEGDLTSETVSTSEICAHVENIQTSDTSLVSDVVEEKQNDNDLIQFDKEVDLATFIGPSPCIILQTLTMSNANDFFNLERLETIGDSFLKFAITVYLYCTYPGIHEGKLSYLRSKQVSNYNLYKLGKKKGFPDCMVAAKFEPTENWLPPGYVIKKEGAYQGLSVHIASMLGTFDRKRESKGNREVADNKDRVNESDSSSGSVMSEKEDLQEAESRSRYVASKKEHEQFNKELEAVIKMDEGEKIDAAHLLKNLIPYNLQTQHSLPDKSIADCVEALIGCYLTTCGQRAALQFMSWLGLKVLPDLELDLDSSLPDHHKAFSVLPQPPSPLLTHLPNVSQILELCLDGFRAFEARICYTFKDKSYLLQAFTHASYHYNTVTDCYQRLEFLGDAILDYVITRHLFEDVKKHSPGILTDLRSALVNNNIFAALAVKWDFHKYFKSVSPHLFYVVEKFVSTQKERNDEIGLDEEFDANDVNVSCSSDTEDIEIPKALGDIFESVAGAIYLDSGMSLDTVWRVYHRMMKPQIDAFTEEIPKSPVRELLEMEPETAKFEKPERTMDGKIRVIVNVVGKGSFSGIGRNYRIAKSAAARRALKYIKQYNIQVSQQLGRQDMSCVQ